MGRNYLSKEALEKNRIAYLEAVNGCKSWRELGDIIGVSKQCVHGLAGRYGIREQINEMLRNNKPTTLHGGGIYKIYFKEEPNSIYIGATNYFQGRKNQHINILGKNIHYCKGLQKLFNKYGVDGYVFEIIERINCKNFKELIPIEKEYIKQYKLDYNILNVSYIHTKEERQALTNTKYPPKKVSAKNIYWHRAGYYNVWSTDGSRRHLGYTKTLEEAKELQRNG